MSEIFDVLVVGAGPGGYVAAIRAAQLGFKVACVDSYVNKNGTPALGGTCLNVGCVPSKALLQSSENYAELVNSFAKHGINAEGVSFDTTQMLRRKDEIIKKNNAGIEFLFRKNKVSLFRGKASFEKKAENLYSLSLREHNSDSVQYLSARNVVIATGSEPAKLMDLDFDDFILDNAGALNLNSAPPRLGIIGAGVIGLEMGSIWNRLGSQVNIFEVSDTFLPNVDEQIAKELKKSIPFNINLSSKILSIKKSAGGVSLHVSVDGKEEINTFDRLIVSIGRKPLSNTISPEAVGLEVDEKGFIKVDEYCKTNLPNVWAIGDVVRGPMLAHKASSEGIMVAERIAGQASSINLSLVPSIIYTSPEVAFVGSTEQSLKATGVPYKRGVSSFSSNARALALGHPTGMVKVLISPEDHILGVHIIGPLASELIASGVLAMEFSASSEDLARTCHAHPTLSEVIHEAMSSASNMSVHS